MTSFTRRDKNAWDWTMLISQPDWITADMIAPRALSLGHHEQFGVVGVIGDPTTPTTPK